MTNTSKFAMVDIARNIKQIRELKNFTQEYMAAQLGISQPSYAKIEQGATVLKIDRLQQIADIFEIDFTALLNTSNIFNIVFNAPATYQNGYINNQNISDIGIDALRKIIQEEVIKNEKQNF
jgi:transcriptional regulator with XRE-family HTH domain